MMSPHAAVLMTRPHVATGQNHYLGQAAKAGLNPEPQDLALGTSSLAITWHIDDRTRFNCGMPLVATLEWGDTGIKHAAVMATRDPFIAVAIFNLPQEVMSRLREDHSHNPHANAVVTLMNVVTKPNN